LKSIASRTAHFVELISGSITSASTGNLSSALRLYVLGWYRGLEPAAGQRSRAPEHASREPAQGSIRERAADVSLLSLSSTCTAATDLLGASPAPRLERRRERLSVSAAGEALGGLELTGAEPVEDVATIPRRSRRPHRLHARRADGGLSHRGEHRLLIHGQISAQVERSTWIRRRRA